MGKHNSSLTRVRPFFRALLDRDPSGASWLPELLGCGPQRGSLSDELKGAPGDLLLSGVIPKKEKRLYPTPEFLLWLISNPDKLTWPDKGTRRFSEKTQKPREELFHGSQDVMRAGIRELEQLGVAKSEKLWWAFEGCTSVDYYLETEKLKLYIEGKRTEMLSAATDWYPARNQLLRNLECARADAKGKPFACLLIVEKPMPDLTQKQIEEGLPHMSLADRESLLKHFLGSATWREVCEATGVAYDSLPDVV